MWIKFYVNCRYGGWVIDGFPLTRESWAAMIENNLLPDFVLYLDDGQLQPDVLHKRAENLSAGHAVQSDVKVESDVCKRQCTSCMYVVICHHYIL